MTNNQNGDIVHHKDEDKMNPRADNLEWTNLAENVADYMTRHKGNTHIDRARRTLSSPIVELDQEGNVIAEYKTPQATGYHCKELYKCLKKHTPFRGRIFRYKDDI